MVGAKLGDHGGLDGGRFGVLGFTPSDEEVGVVGELPDPAATGVADRFAGTEAAKLVEPLAEPASASSAVVGLADVDDAGAGHPQLLQLIDGHRGVFSLKCPAGETSRNVGGSSVVRTMTYTPGPVGTPAVGSSANGTHPVKPERSTGSVVIGCCPSFEVDLDPRSWSQLLGWSDAMPSESGSPAPKACARYVQASTRRCTRRVFREAGRQHMVTRHDLAAHMRSTRRRLLDDSGEFVWTVTRLHEEISRFQAEGIGGAIPLSLARSSG